MHTRVLPIEGGGPVLQATLGDVGGVPLLRIQGELDLATQPALQSYLQQMRSDRDAIVDLTYVGYIDLSGITILEQFHRLLREHRRMLVLVVQSDVVRHVFDILRLGDRIPIVGSTADALGLIEKSRAPGQ